MADRSARAAISDISPDPAALLARLHRYRETRRALTSAAAAAQDAIARVDAAIDGLENVARRISFDPARRRA